MILAWRFPFGDIKIFSPYQPVHTALLGSGGDELKLFACAIFILTVGIKLFAEVLVLVVFERVPAETF